MSIEVNNITHIYSEGQPQQSLALDEVSFTVEKGEFIGIIGHTGSGKSTLVQHLNGLLKPKSGSITINGKNITENKVSMIDIRKKVGLVFQYPEYQLFEETVAKDIAFGPKNLGLSQSEIEERVRWALDQVGLNYNEIKDKSPFDLSGGQKRRVAIAGVIAMKPEVLILDEPTAGLDPKAHREILNMVKRIHENEDSIIILVSHNMNDIATLSDRILVMSRGKVKMYGNPKEVFGREEELKSIGLDLPEVTSLMLELKNIGLESEDPIFTVEEMEAFLYKKLKKESK